MLDLAPERVFRTLRGVGARQAQAAADSWESMSAKHEAPQEATSLRGLRGRKREAGQ
jgi:hypothetical protein